MRAELAPSCEPKASPLVVSEAVRNRTLVVVVAVVLLLLRVGVVVVVVGLSLIHI